MHQPPANTTPTCEPQSSPCQRNADLQPSVSISCQRQHHADASPSDTVFCQDRHSWAPLVEVSRSVSVEVATSIFSSGLRAVRGSRPPAPPRQALHHFPDIFHKRMKATTTDLQPSVQVRRSGGMTLATWDDLLLTLLSKNTHHFNDVLHNSRSKPIDKLLPGALRKNTLGEYLQGPPARRVSRGTSTICSAVQW